MDPLNSFERKVCTGIADLDGILLGGLPSGHVYLVEGTPGTGKTTLALQFVQEGNRSGEKALYVALSETAVELAAVARSHDWDIGHLSIFELSPVEAALKPDQQYTIFRSDEVEMVETVKLILNRIEQERPERVVIDSLAELRLLSGDSIRYRRQLLALKQALTQMKVTVLLLDDRTSHSLDFQVHSLVHGVITLERLPRDYGKNRRRLEVVKMRGAPYIEGFHDYVINTGGMKVFPRMASSHHLGLQQVEKVSSNMPGLDQMLGGGLERGSSTLVLGPSGSGKTTLSLKYAAAAVDRAEPVALYTFDEGLASLLTRGEALGMDIRKHVQDRKILIEQINPAELSPGDFADRVRHSVEVEKAQVVIIDSLNGYLTSMPQEEFLTLQMHELLFYLNEHKVVTILILSQQGVLGSTQPGVDVSYLADSIVLLRFFEAAGRVRRALSVVKKRYSKHEQTIREFTIGEPDGVQIGKPLDTFQGVLSGVPNFIGDPGTLSPHE